MSVAAPNIRLSAETIAVLNRPAAFRQFLRLLARDSSIVRAEIELPQRP